MAAGTEQSKQVGKKAVVIGDPMERRRRQDSIQRDRPSEVPRPEVEQVGLDIADPAIGLPEPGAAVPRTNQMTTKEVAAGGVKVDGRARS